MTNKIFKYAIDVGHNKIRMPQPIAISHMQYVNYPKNPLVCMWIEVDTNTEARIVTAHLIATGEKVPDKCRFGGTTMTPGFFVWHLFIPEREFFG